MRKISIDMASVSVKYAGSHSVRLTLRELQIVHFVLQKPGITTEKLTELLFGEHRKDKKQHAESIVVHSVAIRKKVKPLGLNFKCKRGKWSFVEL